MRSAGQAVCPSNGKNGKRITRGGRAEEVVEGLDQRALPRVGRANKEGHGGQLRWSADKHAAQGHGEVGAVEAGRVQLEEIRSCLWKANKNRRSKTTTHVIMHGTKPKATKAHTIRAA